MKLIALTLLLAAATAHAEVPLSEAGKSVYENNCITCHGPDMVNPGTVTYDLRKFPKDAKPRFLYSVMNGKGGMPAWKGTLKPEDVEALWAYVLTEGK
ncbi:Cytochrome C oxidase, cbb3-type, subunit III [Noviherbaspirillum humi]|uniref:Cytochrome C oxidase, cbb3-type, subunit III n=1 Tax=Noviherbaspirillum humi TaxID=1688639 RepID=A0A239I4T1_9BURK|nr:cytochrome c [Noviherbaspirillum humi]SNS88083.1 Cytochrome C oxidase, cbb3-type, subunit III [Noviherbaspirillum humi]